MLNVIRRSKGEVRCFRPQCLDAKTKATLVILFRQLLLTRPNPARIITLVRTAPPSRAPRSALVEVYALGGRPIRRPVRATDSPLAPGRPSRDGVGWAFPSDAPTAGLARHVSLASDAEVSLRIPLRGGCARLGALGPESRATWAGTDACRQPTPRLPGEREALKEGVDPILGASHFREATSFPPSTLASEMRTSS